ncbi:hypothetical protein Scep_005960 [Stephania cephalantha]|uniref:Uncharacterized protein n=1 Tax=Stephania cephalantha TaxID=152367 RepID=A0AAP0PJM2_9MAGN
MGLGYEEFMSFVYNSLEIDNEKMISTITYRYPAYIGSGTANYVPVRIDDEASLKDVWEIVAELPPPKCMEFYIDLRTRDSYNSTNCNMALDSVAGPSTQPNMERVIVHRPS